MTDSNLVVSSPVSKRVAKFIPILQLGTLSDAVATDLFINVGLKTPSMSEERIGPSEQTPQTTSTHTTPNSDSISVVRPSWATETSPTEEVFRIVPPVYPVGSPNIWTVHEIKTGYSSGPPFYFRRGPIRRYYGVVDGLLQGFEAADVHDLMNAWFTNHPERLIQYRDQQRWHYCKGIGRQRVQPPRKCKHRIL